MNTPSFTAERELRRCPRRYFFRYRYEPPRKESEQYDLRRGLFSLPELAGYLIHQELSLMVQGANGGKSWEVEEASERSLERFLTLVSASLATEPGQLLRCEQLAETFNGLTYIDLRQDIKFWISKIPTALLNGRTAFSELPLPRPSPTVLVETDKAFEKQIRGQRWGVMDVLVTSPFRKIVADFKCHAIRNDDVRQVQEYLNHLQRMEGSSELSLTGWAIDVLSGEKMEIKHNPHRRVDTSCRVEDYSWFTRVNSRDECEYPALPSAELCSRCPYADLCKYSAMNPPVPFKASMSDRDIGVLALP